MSTCIYCDYCGSVWANAAQDVCTKCMTDPAERKHGWVVVVTRQHDGSKFIASADPDFCTERGLCATRQAARAFSARLRGHGMSVCVRRAMSIVITEAS